MAKIVIVEDDENIRKELKRFLCNAGYEAAYLEDFSSEKEIADKLLSMHPDLILLDMKLPGTNGLLICDELRARSDVPIIFVTGNNTSMDELNCMLRGGDDYIAKPYQMPVLLAHIAAVLRRTMNNTSKKITEYDYKGVKFDIGAGSISHDGKRQMLTKNELKILHFLFEHQGEIVSRADLLDYLWENEVFIDDNTLSVNITRIRGKLEQIGISDYIETRRGMGYRI